MSLSRYKSVFGLLAATFTRIDHTDTMIAEVYRVEMPSKHPLILKICPRSDDYFREVYFLQRLQNHIPVPDLIATSEPSDDLFGAILMECIEGTLVAESEWNHELAFEAGTVLATLHNIRANAYGDATKSLEHSPATYFTEKFTEELEECSSHLSESLIKQCYSYLHQHPLTDVDGPCIVHRDFRPGNILVSHGKLQGIIDWSSARFGFAEQDLYSLAHMKPLLAGYSSVRPLPNYQPIATLLQLGKALAAIGYTVKSNTWNKANAQLYATSRQFLDSFNFAD